MLFDIICTVGCRMTTGPSSQIYQLLNKYSKSRVCEVLVGSVAASLEAVQALLIVASYSEKGWMLTSIATRMAMQLDLPGAYEDAVRFCHVESGTIFGEGTMLEPSTPHIGKGVALVAQAAAPVYPRVYRRPTISDSRNDHS